MIYTWFDAQLEQKILDGILPEGSRVKIFPMIMYLIFQKVCPDHTVFGFQCETNGAMAEYMIFPERAKVHKVPENVIAKHAAFVEPLACSIHGVELGNIQFNDVVVISGCGPIGLGMVAAASLKRFWVILSIKAAFAILVVFLKPIVGTY